MTPLEFVDYIFDRYAFLEVDPAAPASEVRHKIARRRAANHTDKLQNVSEAILQTAAQERELLDACASVLLNDTLRQLYDVELAQFREASPHLVSTSGVPILDPTRLRIDLDYLLQEDVRDLTQLQAMAAQMSGHDERRLEKARSRYARDPDDLDFREALRDALTHKVAYLGALEDFFWQKAGIHGSATLNDDKLASSAQHFRDQLQRQLSDLRTRVGQAVEQRNSYASLGFTPVLHLTHSGSEGDAQDGSAQLTTRVLNAFHLRVEDLAALVEQKSQVIEELTTVCRWSYLNAVRGTDSLDIVFLTSDADVDEHWPGPKFVQRGVLLRFTRSTGVAKPQLVTLDSLQLANWPHELVGLELNIEIPGLFVEACALAARLTPKALDEPTQP